MSISLLLIGIHTVLFHLTLVFLFSVRTRIILSITISTDVLWVPVIICYNIASKFVQSNSIVWACFIFLLCMLMMSANNPLRKNNFPWGSKCYKTIDSYVSCVFIEIWSTWEVWRALKKLEFLSAMPQATLTHLSWSSNFLHASYLYERTLMYEPIVNCLGIWGWVVDFWEIRWLAGGTQGRSVIANIV